MTGVPHRSPWEQESPIGDVRLSEHQRLAFTAGTRKGKGYIVMTPFRQVEGGGWLPLYDKVRAVPAERVWELVKLAFATADKALDMAGELPWWHRDRRPIAYTGTHENAWEYGPGPTAETEESSGDDALHES